MAQMWTDSEFLLARSKEKQTYLSVGKVWMGDLRSGGEKAMGPETQKAEAVA